MNNDGIDVALLAPLPPPIGGIGTWALRTKAAAPAGCRIVLVNEGLIGGREFFGEKSKKNLSDEWRRCRRIWSDLDAALSSGDINIVHANIPAVPGGILRELRCARIAHAHGCKFIIHWHSTVSQSIDSPITDLLLRRICNVADAVLVLNEKSRAYVEARTNTPVRLLPNYVSEKELRNEVSVRDGISSCLYVGGVCEDKGIYDFLKVAARFPNISFKAIGKVEDGVSEAAPANVTLTGPLDHAEVESAMREADVFFFLTHYKHEGFSVALTEAMAAGLPCIATDWAANADMLGKTGGFIVPPGDVDAGEKALTAMMDRDVREAMSRSNLAKVKDTYSATDVLGELLDIYYEVLSAPEAR